ncbi:MAG: outer membrane beta-barrel protein, partial [Muribaculaceae bacterium]|nr:outer membrane beta-barrel protein [Muribaculaceae bacterium]
FGFEAQLLYTLRSSTFHMEERKAWSSLGLGKERVMLHYIDVPISLKFKYRNMNGFENTLAPLIYAGPVFSFLVGHSKVGNQLRYDHLNIGLRIGIGVELFSRVQISGNYTFSVGEALRTKFLEEHSAKNRCWSITAAYLF